MATKVKGEAIKEGSIPLNAICDSASLSSVFNVGTPFLSLATDDKYYIINNYKNNVFNLHFIIAFAKFKIYI